MPRQTGLLLKPKARFTVGRKTAELGADDPTQPLDKAAPGTPEKAEARESNVAPPRDGGSSAKRGNSGRLAGGDGRAQRSKLEPLSYLEPKVMVPYDVPPGAVPRRVEVDRKKRLFAAQDVPSLVASEGVDLIEPSAFGVDVFDNTDMEQRLGEEWVPAELPDGGSPSPALVAFRSGDGNEVEWKQCKVTEYSAGDNKYKCEPLDGSSDPLWMPRIFVHFLAEDPFLYSKRLARAVRERRQAEMFLRYNFYIDSMPTEDIPPLMAEQVNRMLGYALNSKKLKDKLMDTSQLVNEVNIEYARTMNKVVFDASLGRLASGTAHELMIPMPETFPTGNPKPVPETGCISIPSYDFAEQFSEFSFHSLLTKQEVILTSTKIRTECLKVLKMNLFNVYVSKSLRLDEFEQTQTQASDQVANYLKETWITTLKNSIKSSFKDVGKGWYNIHETNRETYEFSKLKKFLNMIRYVMEDTMRFLVEDSLEKYARFIQSACCARVTVLGTNQVEVEDPGAGPKKVPLLAVELMINDEESRFQYNTPLPSVPAKVVSVFNHALNRLTGISQLEPSIMENLFWAYQPQLTAVHPMEPEVAKLREACEKGVKESLVAVQAYLDKFERFRGLLILDVEAYVGALKAKGEDLTLGELKVEVAKAKQELAELQADIPLSKVVGMCLVSCTKVREKLLARKEKQVEMLTDLVAHVPKQAMMGISAKFNAINQELRKPCADIEAVDGMRKYIEDLPRVLMDLKAEVASTRDWYKALSDMRYTLPDEDFKEKDKGETWHIKLQRTCASTLKLLDSDQKRYEEEMLLEQESFTENLVVLAQNVESLASYTDLGRLDHVAKEVDSLHRKIKEAEQGAAKFNSREALVGLPPTDYSSLKKTMDQFDPFYQAWSTSSKWRNNLQSWMKDSWTKLDAEAVERDVTNAFKVMFKMGKVFNNRGLEQQAANCETIRREVEQFKKFVPLVHALRNPGMANRHWDQLSSELGVDLHPDASFTLSRAEEMGLLYHLDLITKVSEIAGKEFAIETALDRMQHEWGEVELGVMEYRETGTFVIKVEESVTQQLDDNIVMTQSMTFSPYKKPFEERIMKWEQQLNLVSEILDEWLALQRQWMYLEPIFSSEDIMQQLPLEGKRFASVDRMWRKVLQNTKMNPLVLRVCNSHKLLDQFVEGNKLLDSVQKGLSDYLETKRLAFSRFFFLSNDELLQILSQAKNPLAVQPHLRKCFEAIENLVFAEDLEISCMISREGEKCPFDQNMYPTGNVENWLSAVERRMIASTRDQTAKSLVAYETDKRTDWVRKWPAMVVIAVNSIFWSKNVEAAIRGSSIPQFLEQSVSELMDLTDLVRGKLTGLERMTMGALITIDVHARDVVQGLVLSEVTTTTDFEWVSQLRYYWRDDVKVEMVQACISYGYEYLGNTPRLVITPLTDRCYMTLMSAMHLNLGGAPAGPAGTGKTETTKDLAKALAKQCVVFNCSDGLDYIAMGKFFKGLASSGAWACFDEFNRIDLEVLSVVAQQILTIQLAIQSKVKRFIFEDTEIDLNPACNVYITMNPGYAGRSELPDNLKALFRPCAMMVPDYALIGEICLYSYGYRDAKNLARKMVATFRLCSEQLSSQDHYDYGMRAVKSVITAAGNLKREFPDEDEEVLLLRGLRDINVPKFLSHDLPLFSGIISDLFPGVKPPDVDYDDLLRAMEEACSEQKIQPVDTFINKVIQLYETTIVRHGLMLVGPTMGGKTCNYRTLQSAMTKLAHLEKFEKVRVVALNPKSITMGQLYGEFDENTHEWTDGVLACYMRECSDDTKPDKKWIMFDGPVDAIWIENMNTVLDDNKKLCLVSGEIIQLSSQMTMMFEVEDLAVASPATVSRCGMIYMEPSAMGMEPLLVSWLRSLPRDFQGSAELMGAMFRALVPGLVYYVRKNLKETVITVDHNLVLSLFNIMDAFIQPWIRSEIQEPLSKDETQQLKKMMPAWFLFALTWSVGATCDKPGRAKFDNRLRQAIDGSSLDLPEGTVFPDGMSPYDCCYSQESMCWVDWMSTIPEYKVDPEAAFADIIVPTSDTVCYTYIIDMLLAKGCHVLAVGETGTGKTLNVANKLMNDMPAEVENVFVMFSARTSANQTQDMIDAKMDKRRKGVFGPPSGKRYIIFVDDLNMPQREKYFAQPPIELIRQWMDYGGWYERKPPCAFRKIIDTQFVGAMGPPGGGRNPITNRLLRHFNFLSFVEMSDRSLVRVFDTILASFFSRGFDEDVQNLASPIVAATIETYNTIREELLPTPSKSHYTFNLRDLAKVIQGVLRAGKSLGGPDQILALWLHEATRVFQDRLINDEDHGWFRKQITTMLRKHMGREWTAVVDVERLIFGDYMVPGADPKIYAQVRDMTSLVKTVEEYLEDLNSVSNAPMKLVMFLDAIEHVSRICRVIRQPLGNALLLGVGGSGRQSLTRLAAFMEEFDVFQIEIVKGYGSNEWRDDLRKCLKKAGVPGKDTVFLFTDSQIVIESFLEDINNMLNSGEVPNLMKNEDLEEIGAAMRPLMQAAGLPITKNGIYAYFVRRVRSFLHVVLAMNPIGDAFRQRLRMFPALVNCCTIDWFREWPQDALKDVAFNFFADIPMGGPEDSPADEEKLLKSIVNTCVYIHQSVEHLSVRFFDEQRRHNYVTPTSYLELLSTFIKLIGEKRDEIGTTKRRLEIGLAKLLSTADEVEVMKQELEDLQPILTATSAEVEQMMVQIAQDKQQADEKKAVVTKQEEEANVQADAAKKIADSAQKDLDEALPALEASLQALKSLSRDQVVIVKSLANPPAGVKLVMEATCIMFEEKPKMVADPNKPGKKIPDYWEVSKKLLNDPTKFLDSLTSYDRDNIPKSVIDKIEPYIQMEEFTPENVERVSKACTCICMWVRAMYTYYNVSLSVEPKRRALKEAEETLEKTMAELKVAQETLAAVQAKIQQLEEQYDEAVAKKDALAKQVADCQVKLERADKLIGGLGGEKVRWQATVEQLAVDLINVAGDVMVASGTIAYSGPFTPLYRAVLLKGWVAKLQDLGVPHTPGTNIISVLQDPVMVRQWNIHGLPTDSVSVENGIILNKARRWPLMIDPQGQANKWVKNMERERGLDVIKLSEKDFLRTLENGVRFGRAVLLENIAETLDAALEPILLKQTFKQGGSIMIKVGDNIIPYHQDFRFYLTTKYRNPHYAPEISVKVSVLNFFVTTEGLEEQLLGITVTEERPDLAEAKNQLVVNNAKMKKELKEIEDKILFMLSNSQGNILDDEELINTLAQSKVTSNEITEKVAVAEKTEKEIDVTREQYRPVAIRASLLFFCISDLALVDPMYQYSLAWFIALFIRGIGEAPVADKVDRRGVLLNEYFTYSLYVNVCRSLFERHKLMFSFLLSINILQNQGLVDPVEWRFLLAGPTTTDITKPNPAPAWLTDKCWVEFLNLTRLEKFAGLADHVASNIEHYKTIFDSNDAHEEKLAPPWQERLTGFQKLLFLRCLRPDKVVMGIQNFVKEQVGARFVEVPPFNLGVCFKESAPGTPLIFVLSSGADPMADLLKLAEEMKFTKKFEKVSLGQGQGPKAEKLLELGMDRGMWVCLQNCHLAQSFMPTLERIVEEISPEKVHKDFRLWLTSMPSPTFPVTILQNGVKMTLEPPKGLKSNLMRTYTRFSDAYLADCAKPDAWRKLVFGMSLFHAVIQDRRKFGPLGWNIRYDFTDGDLSVSLTQMKMFLNDYSDIPFRVLNFLFTEINYGGRVTDDKDRRLINNLVRTFCNSDVLKTYYAFSPSLTYCSVECETVREYLEVISAYPLVPRPEIFGLHDNADITCDQNETYDMFATVLSLQPRVSGGKGMSREEVIGNQCIAIQEKLPANYDVDKVGAKYPTSYEESMNTVLVQECIRYNNLLAVMKRTLAECVKALKGLVVMSPELEAVSDAVFDNKVPEAWAAKAYPSLKPLSSWVGDLLERLAFIQRWVDEGVPPVYWISGFFFPQAFLTGTLQNYARKCQMPIDTVSFDFQVVDHLTPASATSGPDDGCYIRGLYMEGARWDDKEHRLDESAPKELYIDFPIIWLKPTQHRKKPDDGFYDCPVYKTLTRAGTLSTTGHSTNFVLYLEVPSRKAQSHWINRGVALFTALAF